MLQSIELETVLRLLTPPTTKVHRDMLTPTVVHWVATDAD